MPQTRRGANDQPVNYLTMLAAAGLLLVGSGMLLAAAPVSDLAPVARQGDDEDEEEVALLSEEDINLIQVYEIDMDTEPRVQIDRDVLQEFLDDPAYAGRDGMPTGRDGHRDFLRWEGWQQLELFFSMRAREYYGSVRVREEPETMRAWQRLNSRYISQYFMRTFANKPLGPGVELRYQGRPISQIPLLGPGRNADAIAYTNFYILTQMTANGIPFIDRDHPEESILVQWGLPREDAKFRAPNIDGWRARFRGMEDEDPRREELIAWVSSLVAVNQDSQYGVEFTPTVNDEEDGE
ncbi:MAG: hypothetical protein AAGA29_13060 [Planctomycetota bacterium]